MGETKDRHLREHEGLADFAEGDAFRCLPQRSLEALDRFAKTFGAEAESLMMDRHDEMSAGFVWPCARLVPECSANESRDCKRRSA
jgi:hypothetical protein